MKMMKAVNKIKIKKGRADEVLARFQKPKSVHTFEGFVLMEVLKKENTEEYDELHICTTWEDHTYFEAWRTSSASEKAHAAKKRETEKPKDSPIIGNELSIFEVSVQHHPA